MTNTFTITVEELDAEAFAPFGEVMSTEALPKLPIDFYGGANSIHGPVKLDCDPSVEPEFVLMRSAVRPLELRYLERHVRITQTFIPLGGIPYVFAAAPADAPEERGFPVPESLRAFLVPGDVALNSWRGTWHEPAFPLQRGQLCLISSHADLTRGLQKGLNEDGELNELDVEKRSPAHRLDLRITLGLPPSHDRR